MRRVFCGIEQFKPDRLDEIASEKMMYNISFDDYDDDDDDGSGIRLSSACNAS